MMRALKYIGEKAGYVLVAVAILLAGYWLSRPVDEASGGSAAGHAEHGEVTEWTCSMHPQIRLPAPGLCPICNMDLIPVTAGSEGGLRELELSAAAVKLMGVETLPVARRFVAREVRMVGKVAYDETRLANITAWVPGRLDRLYVDYTGVPVTTGDHMVELYSPELISAQEALLQAIEGAAAVSGAQSERMRETASRTVDAARDRLRLWGLTAEQIETVEEQGAVQDHVTITAPVSGIVVHKDAVEGKYVQEGTRIYTIADLSRVWVLLDAYESDLGWLRYGQEVEFTTVSHPGEVFRGRIAFIDPVLDARTRTVKVRVNAENEDGRLKPDMFVRAVVRAELAADQKVYDASLVGKWISPMHPEIVKDEPGRCDVCGMPLVTAESLGYTAPAGENAQPPLVVPASAVLMTGTRAIVYVKVGNEESPSFEGREIVLGPRAGDWYVVRHGLREGEEVVARGNFKIDSELQIKARPSMMTPEGGGGGGHDHAGGAGEEKTEGKMPSAREELPALFLHQLGEVMKSAAAVQSAAAEGDMAAAREAFEALGEKIEAVDGSELGPQEQQVWNEYSMRLMNDAVEGATADDGRELERVVAGMGDRMAALGARLGVRAERETGEPVELAGLQEQLRPVLAAYFQWQEALAGDASGEGRQAAGAMLEAVKAVEKESLSDQGRLLWEETTAGLEEVLAAGASAEELAKQREEFNLASEAMIRLARQAGAPGDDAIYVLHCPMAFDNRGANWLQESQEVNNPYFGDMMLRCGGVEEVIAARE